MNAQERQLLDANQELIQLYVQREDARNMGVDDRKLTKACREQKARISSITGKLRRAQHAG